MGLALMTNNMKDFPLIDDISFKIDVCNNLYPLHKNWATVSIHLVFKVIKFKIDLINLTNLMKIKDQLLIDLEQSSMNYLQTRL